MLRFLIAGFITAVASYFALMIMPWWIPMLISFCTILALPMKKGRAFLATGLGVAVCYSVLGILADQDNEHILSSRMAVLFHLPAYWLMIVITSLVGFITAGLGGWTAAALRGIFRKSTLQEDTFVREKSNP